jgi:hypothetical protein
VASGEMSEGRMKWNVAADDADSCVRMAFSSEATNRIEAHLGVLLFVGTL